jgi:integrase
MDNAGLSKDAILCLSVNFIRATVETMENVGFEKVRGTECLYRYRPNGKYYARFVVNGKEVRRSLRTSDRDIAKRHVLQIRRKAAVIDPQASKITLAGLCNRYLPTVRHQAAKTVAQKTYICERIKQEWPAGSDVLIRKVLPSQVQAFLSRYTFGPSSYNAYLAVLRGLFNLAVADSLLSQSPVAALKERRREKPIRLTPTWEQFHQIIADVRAQVFNADAQDSADFLEFLGLAGLGQAEASSLTRSDIDFAKEQITTFRQKTKTGFAIPIYPQVRPVLERLCAGKAHNQRLFRISDAKKALSGACRRLGLPAFSQRSLRRMFITRAIEKGADVKVIAQWQGHKDGGKLILDTYSHVNPVHSQRVAQLMTDVEPKNVLKMELKEVSA